MVTFLALSVRLLATITSAIDLRERYRQLRGILLRVLACSRVHIEGIHKTRCIAAVNEAIMVLMQRSTFIVLLEVLQDKHLSIHDPLVRQPSSEERGIANLSSQELFISQCSLLFPEPLLLGERVIVVSLASLVVR